MDILQSSPSLGADSFSGSQFDTWTHSSAAVVAVFGVRTGRFPPGHVAESIFDAKNGEQVDLKGTKDG